jgi:hypothetical protein
MDEGFEFSFHRTREEWEEEERRRKEFDGGSIGSGQRSTLSEDSTHSCLMAKKVRANRVSYRTVEP